MGPGVRQLQSVKAQSFPEPFFLAQKSHQLSRRKQRQNGDGSSLVFTQPLYHVWVISVESQRICTKLQSKDVDIDALKICVVVQFIGQAVLERYECREVGRGQGGLLCTDRIVCISDVQCPSESSLPGLHNTESIETL